ncbi:hypothetical protein LS73_008295 [Helicobacter muridarum]|uniref:Uncharacterized protein n=1 Tax=Helicobacter muridarum TaxID=216 RepID=A0A099TZX7_9HELI|nr:hypothetical protein [Helicobacter muridarum]TLD98812.1 hypothetical protein LS73_008295 [Helicobacter muridarum]STQ85790.1 Uncharacterised protein [Helicobacter muridarum]
MLILDKNFQSIGGFGVYCYPENGDDVLKICSDHVRRYNVFPQVVYLKSENQSEKKWLGSNSEKFYYNGHNIMEIDEEENFL